jgi:uncharacterized membrane protein
MSYKTFKIWQRVLLVIIAVVVAISVTTGNAIIPIPTVIIGVVLIIILRRRVKDVVADERVYAVADKASRLTLQIVGIAMAAVGGILLAISRGGSSVLAQVGFTLEYATSGLLVIYYIAYIYYNRKLGGKE